MRQTRLCFLALLLMYGFNASAQGFLMKSYLYQKAQREAEAAKAAAAAKKKVTFSNQLYCQWDVTDTTGDWWVAIYNDQLNPLPGTNDYFPILWLKDETTGEWIGASDFLNFSCTGAQQQRQQRSSVFDFTNNSPGVAPMGGGGGYVDYTPGNSQNVPKGKSNTPHERVKRDNNDKL